MEITTTFNNLCVVMFSPTLHFNFLGKIAEVIMEGDMGEVISQNCPTSPLRSDFTLDL